MADISIAGIFTERQESRSVRDCAKPSDLGVRQPKVTRILTIASDCPEPDMVIVNGLKFYPVRAG